MFVVYLIYEPYDYFCITNYYICATESLSVNSVAYTSPLYCPLSVIPIIEKVYL